MKLLKSKWFLIIIAILGGVLFAPKLAPMLEKISFLKKLMDGMKDDHSTTAQPTK